MQFTPLKITQNTKERETQNPLLPLVLPHLDHPVMKAGCILIFRDAQERQGPARIYLANPEGSIPLATISRPDLSLMTDLDFMIFPPQTVYFWVQSLKEIHFMFHEIGEFPEEIPPEQICQAIWQAANTFFHEFWEKCPAFKGQPIPSPKKYPLITFRESNYGLELSIIFHPREGGRIKKDKVFHLTRDQYDAFWETVKDHIFGVDSLQVFWLFFKCKGYTVDIHRAIPF